MEKTHLIAEHLGDVNIRITAPQSPEGVYFVRDGCTCGHDRQYSLGTGRQERYKFLYGA
jgi:hypothetical protein